MIKLIVQIFFVIFIFFLGLVQTNEKSFAFQEDFNVLKGTPEENKAGTMFLNYVKKILFEKINERNQKIEDFKTIEEWKSHIKFVEETFREIIGQFPKKNQLNVKVTGALDRQEYRIEKIIYESLPKFYVTGNLYVPKGVNFPVPAVLNVLGHTNEGKAFESYQAIFINLAKRGYVDFVIDPISQGERQQYLNRKSGEDLLLGSPTVEHNMAGYQCFLLGINLALYRIWDGIRAIDYLYTRPEVDKERIACTGNSGGGTLTSYLSGLDKRIKVSIPVDYITTWQSRIEAGLSTDAEQLFPNSIAKWVDNRSDFTFLIAPRPLLIGIGIRDPLNPYSGVIAFKPVIERLYERFGDRDKVKFAIFDVEHEYSKQHRQELYLWLNKWFNYGDANVEEEPFATEDEKTLWCTSTGQVLTSLGGKSVAELNRDYAKSIIPKFKEPKSIDEINLEQKRILEIAKKLTGYKPLTHPIESRIVGSFQFGDFIGEKVIYYSESDVFIPGILIFPTKNKPPYPSVVYLDETAKISESKSNNIIKTLLNEGVSVFIIDTRGTGETTPQKGGDPFLYSIMTNQPAFGMQIQDVICALSYLENRNEIDKEKIGIIGKGLGGLLALYASAFNSKFKITAIIENLYTYKSLVENDIYNYGLEVVIPDVLKYYDIPNLAGTIAPRPLSILNPTDHNKKVVDKEILYSNYKWTNNVYSKMNSGKNLQILTSFKDEEINRKLIEWINLFRN